MRRRIRAMRRRGIRYIGANTPELLMMACRMSLTSWREDEWCRGVVYDRGAKKDHGVEERYVYPMGYDGGAIYWLRSSRKRT